MAKKTGGSPAQIRLIGSRAGISGLGRGDDSATGLHPFIGRTGLDGEEAYRDISRIIHTRRQGRGAFYTPASAAEFMAAWVLESAPQTVLEPSFGDGTFLHALNKVSSEMEKTPPRLIGVEIDEQAFSRTVESGVIQPSDAILDDFLRVNPIEVDAVIGNPPYVRLRHMTAMEAGVAMDAVSAQLGIDMEPSGSLWMPFVAHAVPFVRRGGRLALVLPLDATYVRYARPLWAYLASQFGELQVIRSRERVFPNILQDVIILMASNKGATCNTVGYRAYLQIRDFLMDSPEVEADIEVAAIVEGERPFVWAHIKPELRELLTHVIEPNTVPARKMARFNIGYIAGDKSFFHPSNDARSRFGLTDESLVRTVSSSRSLRGAGLYTSRMPDASIDNLFYPLAGDSGMSDSDLAYVRYGVQLGVDQRYKCRVRDPWYIVPYVKSPDVVLTVFTERPILAVNDDGIAASNSLLCGYLDGIDAPSFAARWYTSVTLLHIETEVHSLGGGVMIMVPRETGNIRIVSHVNAPRAGLEEVDRHLAMGDVEGAYKAGDRVVLKETLGLNDSDLELVYEGIASLAHWRTSARAVRNGHG